MFCGRNLHLATQNAWRNNTVRQAVCRDLLTVPKQSLRNCRNDVLNNVRLNHTLINMHRNLLQNLRNLRGQKLRQFRSYMKQLQQDFKLWSSEEKSPEGFGKFYPKNGSKNTSNNQSKQPKSSQQQQQQQQQQPRERGQQIEFKFSIGSGKGGGGGKGPMDPNMYTLIGFSGVVAILFFLSSNKLR